MLKAIGEDDASTTQRLNNLVLRRRASTLADVVNISPRHGAGHHVVGSIEDIVEEGSGEGNSLAAAWHDGGVHDDDLRDGPIALQDTRRQMDHERHTELQFRKLQFQRFVDEVRHVDRVKELCDIPKDRAAMSVEDGVLLVLEGPH